MKQFVDCPNCRAQQLSLSRHKFELNDIGTFSCEFVQTLICSTKANFSSVWAYRLSAMCSICQSENALSWPGLDGPQFSSYRPAGLPSLTSISSHESDTSLNRKENRCGCLWCCVFRNVQWVWSCDQKTGNWKRPFKRRSSSSHPSFFRGNELYEVVDWCSNALLLLSPSMNQVKPLVGLKAVCLSPPSLIMECMSRGNLYDYLQTKPQFGWELRLRIAIDMAQAMTYLHAQLPPIMHGDFKSPNILVRCNVFPVAFLPLVIQPRSSVLLFKMYMFRRFCHGDWLRKYLTLELCVICMWSARAKVLEIEQSIIRPGSRLKFFAILTSMNPLMSIRMEVPRTCHHVSPLRWVLLWELLSESHPYGEFNCRFNSDLENLILSGQRPTIPRNAHPEYREFIWYFFFLLYST